jgi:hypothetical protein
MLDCTKTVSLLLAPTCLIVEIFAACHFLFVCLKNKQVVHKNMVDGNSMIGFLLVIADSEQDVLGIKPGPLVWPTSALTTLLQEVRNASLLILWKAY